MSWEQDIRSISRTAAVDLTNHKNKFVSLNAAGLLIPCQQGAMPLGILRNNPAAGQTGTVAYAGVVKCQVGTAAVSPTAPVKVDANACAAPAVPSYVNTSDAGAPQDALVGSNIAGLPLEAGAAGDIVPVLLSFGGGTIPTTAA